MKSLIFLALATFAIGQYAGASCFPDNGLWVTKSSTKKTDAIGKKVFDSAIDKVLNHWGPIVKKQLGCNLVFNRLWDDGTVNSDTDVEGSDCVVNSYGGLARYKGMDSESAYAAVACHEVGHHMGGAPLYTGDAWASVEGEADYWATKDCMKAIGYSDQEIGKASLALAMVLADLGGEPVPDPAAIDSSVVSTTFEEHPAAQCRLDTYLSGLNCNVLGPMSPSDAKVGSCYDYPSGVRSGKGSRPRCWFAPASSLVHGI